MTEQIEVLNMRVSYFLPVLECERRRWPARSCLSVLRRGGELGWMSRNCNEAERDEGSGIEMLERPLPPPPPHHLPPNPRSDSCSSSWSVDQNHYKPEHPGVFGPSLISHLSTATLRQSRLCLCLCFAQWKKTRVQQRSESSVRPVCHRQSDGRVNVLRQPNPDKHAQQTNPDLQISREQTPKMTQTVSKIFKRNIQLTNWSDHAGNDWLTSALKKCSQMSPKTSASLMGVWAFYLFYMFKNVSLKQEIYHNITLKVLITWCNLM